MVKLSAETIEEGDIVHCRRVRLADLLCCHFSDCAGCRKMQEEWKTSSAPFGTMCDACREFRSVIYCQSNSAVSNESSLPGGWTLSVSQVSILVVLEIQGEPGPVYQGVS